MKMCVLTAAIITILFASCASADIGSWERENYRQNKKIQKQAERSNRHGYDANKLGNVLGK